MTTSNNTITRDQPEMACRVRVRTHATDFGFLEEATLEREREVMEANSPGCWYLNPQATVSCSKPTREFFQKARKCQAKWYRKLNHSLGSASCRRNQRHEKDDSKRRRVHSGILVIDGDIIDPQRWYSMEADIDMYPDAYLVVSRKRVGLRDIDQDDHLETLKNIARKELEAYLSMSPSDPLYVTPGITVTATRYNAEFLQECQRRSNEWHRTLDRRVGSALLRQLARKADLATRMLVFNGTLVIGGNIYNPGHWPKHQQLCDASPLCIDKDTVSPELLGISVNLCKCASVTSLSNSTKSQGII